MTVEIMACHYGVRDQFEVGLFLRRRVLDEIERLEVGYMSFKVRMVSLRNLYNTL